MLYAITQAKMLHPRTHPPHSVSHPLCDLRCHSFLPHFFQIISHIALSGGTFLYHNNLQCSHLHHQYKSRASTCPLRAHSQQYSFPINFLGQARKLEAIAINSSLEKHSVCFKITKRHIARPFFICTF